MVSVAIIEDDAQAAQVLKEYIKEFSESEGVELLCERYRSAVEYFGVVKPAFDIIFMDIEMPGMNGMDAALTIRETDKQAVIIFVTNMAQFAVKGYEADALAFMIKPLKYSDFAIKFKRAVEIAESNVDAEIVIPRQSGIVRISAKSVRYVEVSGHKLSYHTSDGEVTSCTGSLSDAELQFEKYNFLRCNSCYLLNPRYIAKVVGYTVIMRGGEELSISHPRKQKFMADLANYLGRGGG